MTDIPEDIRAEAEMALQAVWHASSEEVMVKCIAHALLSERTRATEAERERCAKIAEGPATAWGDFPGGVPERDRIAASIRTEGTAK